MSSRTRGGVNRLHSRKLVSFTHAKDFLCTLRYDQGKKEAGHLPPGTNREIQVYDVSGIEKLVADKKYADFGTPKINLSFLLDSMGFVGLVKAEAVFEKIIEEEPEPEPAADADADADADAEKKDEKDEGDDAAKEGGDNAAKEEGDDAAKDDAKKDEEKEEGDDAAKEEEGDDAAKKEGDDAATKEGDDAAKEGAGRSGVG